MATFRPNVFQSHPSLEKFKNSNIKKDDWKFRALHFDTDNSISVRKEGLKNTVIKALVGYGIIEEEALDTLY